jgi:hypothetical protein
LPSAIEAGKAEPVRPLPSEGVLIFPIVGLPAAIFIFWEVYGFQLD